jgi:chemotaxis-related protein WspD
MSSNRDVADRPESSVVDCWNRIGVRGDGSCPELKQYVHCHNCPVYCAAALTLLDAEPPSDYSTDWTTHFAKPEVIETRQTESVVIFRLGAEWLALPTPVITEVAALRKIHSLPHRRSGVVLGVANVHGELLVCVSLTRVLGLTEPSDSSREAHRSAQRRLLVIRREEMRTVCPVDEVSGIHHVDPREMKDPPLTVAKATAYSKKVLSWQEQPVGLLDDQLLFYTLKRSFA